MLLCKSSCFFIFHIVSPFTYLCFLVWTQVKYGDTLRRFNAHVKENEQLDLNMTALRAKILYLFNFPADCDLALTYIDEDGDVVTLADDDDLRDVMRQNLKFLRIDAQLNNDKFGKSYARSSGSSTPMRSPRVQSPLPCLNNGVAEVLKSVPEPLQGILSKISHDLASKAVASKAVASNAVLTELADCFSKMGQSHLNPAPSLKMVQVQVSKLELLFLQLLMHPRMWVC